MKIPLQNHDSQADDYIDAILKLLFLSLSPAGGEVWRGLQILNQ
jgi:hypothetical protein